LPGQVIWLGDAVMMDDFPSQVTIATKLKMATKRSVVSTHIEISSQKDLLFYMKWSLKFQFKLKFKWFDNF
jgi:hypothetical protein